MLSKVSFQSKNKCGCGNLVVRLVEALKKEIHTLSYDIDKTALRIARMRLKQYLIVYFLKKEIDVL